MAKYDNKNLVLQFCRSQIRTLNGKFAGIEKIIDEYFLGKNIRHKRENPDLFDEKNKMQHSKFAQVKEKLMNDICYYMIGTQIKIRFDEPRTWLEDIWTIYASCRQQEYENSLYKKTWDLKNAKESAENAFKEDMEISDLLRMSYEREIPDSLLLKKINDTDLRSFVKKIISDSKPNTTKSFQDREQEIFNHNFIYKHGIYDTPQALVERTILIRALLLLNGINPYGNRNSENEQEQYAFENPIKATIFGMNLLASRFRKTLFKPGEKAESAQSYWLTSSTEFKLYEECVLGGINRLIDKLENFTRLDSYDPKEPEKEKEFKGPISLKVLASLRDITSIRMSLELRENDNSRKLLGLKRKNLVKKRLAREAKKEGKEKKYEKFENFEFSLAYNYLLNHPKTSKVFSPLEIKILGNENRDLNITDILN